MLDFSKKSLIQDSLNTKKNVNSNRKRSRVENGICNSRATFFSQFQISQAWIRVRVYLFFFLTLKTTLEHYSKNCVCVCVFGSSWGETETLLATHWKISTLRLVSSNFLYSRFNFVFLFVRLLDDQSQLQFVRYFASNILETDARPCQLFIS